MLYKDYKIVKSNELINSKSRFTLMQQRVILLMTARIKPTDDDFTTYEIPISEILGLTPNEKVKGSQYDDVREAAVGLTNSAIYLQKGEKWKSMAFITVAEGEKGKNYITVQFSPQMKPFFLNLRNNYTSYFLKHVFSFKSAHSIRIYELLAQYYPNIRQRKFDVEYLKDILYVGDKYSRFFDFKKYVIEASIKEINALSDINVEYELEKRGRKVVAMIFYMSANERTDPKLLEQDRSASSAIDESEKNEAPQVVEVVESIKAKPHTSQPESSQDGKYQIKPETAQKLAEKYGQEIVDFYIKCVNDKKEVSNKTGYLITALKNEYFHKEYKSHINTQKRRKLKSDLEREKLNYENRLADISKDYELYLKDIKNRLIEEATLDDEAEYLFDLEMSSNSYVKKFIPEWESGKPSELALGFYGTWLIQNRLTDEEQEICGSLKSYAIWKYDFEIKE
ncbi:hypothetical protein AUTU_48190 (plasmid) [Aureibacter tunicatorum]|nr:hypothetical protein AUTU_48190 [Aureibacter tunicatorum]